jgi:hypothetical protein
MSDIDPSDRGPSSPPPYRPAERFWPYADLSDDLSEEELVRLRPELREVLFGTSEDRPFSISLTFPAFSGENYARALEMARRSDEYVEGTWDGVLTHRARFFPATRPADLRDLWDLICDVPGTDVLVDDRPVPYARTLWLPLVWFLIR